MNHLLKIILVESLHHGYKFHLPYLLEEKVLNRLQVLVTDGDDDDDDDFL
jgi:hypothetical protein